MRVGGGEQLPNSSVNSHRGGPGDGGGGGEGGFGGGGDGGFDGGDGGFDGGGPSGEQEPQLRRQLTSMYPGFLAHSPELAQDAQLAGQASTHSDNARPLAATAATSGSTNRTRFMPTAVSHRPEISRRLDAARRWGDRCRYEPQLCMQMSMRVR